MMEGNGVCRSPAFRRHETMPCMIQSQPSDHFPLQSWCTHSHHLTAKPKGSTRVVSFILRSRSSSRRWPSPFSSSSLASLPTSPPPCHQLHPSLPLPPVPEPPPDDATITIVKHFSLSLANLRKIQCFEYSYGSSASPGRQPARGGWHWMDGINTGLGVRGDEHEAILFQKK